MFACKGTNKQAIGKRFFFLFFVQLYEMELTQGVVQEQKRKSWHRSAAGTRGRGIPKAH